AWSRSLSRIDTTGSSAITRNGASPAEMPRCRARRPGRRARMTRDCLTRGEARLARVTRIVLPSVAVLSTVLRTLTLLVLLATTAGAQSRDRVGGRDRDAHEARA